jgi:methionyl aminopeptidase
LRVAGFPRKPANRTRHLGHIMHTLDIARSKERDAGKIRIYGEHAFEQMRKVGRLAAEALDLLVEHIVPGVSTERLDDLVFEFAMNHRAIPAPLNYRGFPKSICTSINHVVCHGIPGPKPLREGDIVNIDVTLILEGWHGDSSRMYPVGTINRRAERLIEVTYESLLRGIEAVRPGNTTGDIGAAIQTYVEAQRCSVVRDFCGHGLGDVFHDRPNILHYGKPGEGIVLQPGMIFTIEPMINLGKAGVKVLNDGWTAVTRDKSLSAQFEHTVGVTSTGVEVFTYSPSDLHCPVHVPDGQGGQIFRYTSTPLGAKRARPSV